MLNYPIFIMKPTLISFAYFIVCLYSPLPLLTVDGENIIQASYLKRVRRKASDRACMILKQQTWFVIAADCTVSGLNAFNKIINNEIKGDHLILATGFQRYINNFGLFSIQIYMDVRGGQCES